MSMLNGAGPAIRVEGLGKRFWIGARQQRTNFLNTTRRLLTGWMRQQELWALREVGFEVGRGEALGVIGPNGSGKSTLLLLLAQILAPTEGRVRVSGRTNCFFQIGAALQSNLTVLENFSICSTLLGISRKDFKKRLPAMIEYSGLEEYVNARYGELSCGLAARLPFAAAVHAEIDVLLVDEMFMVGDQSFQTKCWATFKEFRSQGKTLVMVSHSLQSIEALCSRALYLKAGRTAFIGETGTAVRMLLQDAGCSPSAPPPGTR